MLMVVTGKGGWGKLITRGAKYSGRRAEGLLFTRLQASVPKMLAGHAPRIPGDCRFAFFIAYSPSFLQYLD